MSTDQYETPEMCADTRSQQEPPESSNQTERLDGTGHGNSGEGAGSAMAHLISREQARRLPGEAGEKGAS